MPAAVGLARRRRQVEKSCSNVVRARLSFSMYGVVLERRARQVQWSCPNMVRARIRRSRWTGSSSNVVRATVRPSGWSGSCSNAGRATWSGRARPTCAPRRVVMLERRARQRRTFLNQEVVLERPARHVRWPCWKIVRASVGRSGWRRWCSNAARATARGRARTSRAPLRVVVLEHRARQRRTFWNEGVVLERPGRHVQWTRWNIVRATLGCSRWRALCSYALRETDG